MKIGFDNEKYLAIQKKEILDRISHFGDKLYIEFGGKLFDDYHASRVLPGFRPDSKLSLLLSLKDKAEIIIVINSEDIMSHKTRGDLGITYDVEVQRLIISYQRAKLPIAGVVFSFMQKNKAITAFMRKLKNMGINVYKQYAIEGYPYDVNKVCSESGFGINDYIPTSKPIVVVTAPGPGSGKLACCMSQLYHDSKRGIKSGYAKYETFPVWNLGLCHPVNLAYEAATVDLKDIIMEDPYHLEAYGKHATNYNRDIAAFPLVNALLKHMNGNCPYKSPTDMGVNMVGFAISNEKVVEEACKKEVVRRYYSTSKDLLNGKVEIESIEKIKELMSKLNTSIEDRKCVKPALNKAEKTGMPSVAIELTNGKIITGKRSDLLTSTSAMLLNALKYLAGIPNNELLLQREVIIPIQELKVNDLHNVNPKIHGEEILIGLAIQATSNENAKKALSHLHELNGCEAHSSCILSVNDYKTLSKLGIQITEEPTNYIYKVSLN